MQDVLADRTILVGERCSRGELHGFGPSASADELGPDDRVLIFDLSRLLHVAALKSTRTNMAKGAIMTRSDEDFYRVRAQEEYARAELATNDCARRAHLELARMYTERLHDGTSMAPRRGGQPDLLHRGR